MNLQQNIPLKNYSNYKIGGMAKYFVQVETTEELKEVLRLANSLAQDKIAILGSGTNVLINDKGFDGLVILNRIGGITEGEGGNLTVGSGTLVRDLLAHCAENSLTGLEWAGGLPGTIGGAVRGNAGAFKGEIKDIVVAVESLDLKTASNVADAFNEKIRNNAQCQFTYRNSIFKSGDGVNEFITHVILALTLGDKKEIEEKIQQKVDYRNNRHPMDYPSIGSIFKNIPLDSLSHELQKEFAPFVKMDPFPAVPTTKLLALCDLKGRRVGDAMISDKHPNFIINVDNATAEDVKALIEIAKQAVKEKYNLVLEEEIIYLN
ncbi:MAG: UDP-N-acetylmuramate dehydrogenase [Candidatus Levybacteria bacterium]|nr:UDP-N-acetylmuramate dehydrogenase [Candidatus Levybacteria bacterium]MDZ4227845.1 UDP-N-acetylmuramate dehydrogenase [Candidatus Levybacteria bacterium]